MAKQFTSRSFARGVKLTAQHVQTPTDAVASALSQSAVTGNLKPMPWRLSLHMPQLDSSAFEYQTGTPDQQSRVVIPFVLPPLQEDFDSSTWKQPTDQPVLTSISIGFDQRAEPYATTDLYSATEGLLTDTDMDRLTLTLDLLERTPTLLGGNETDYRVVHTVTLPGQELWGNLYARQNPMVIDEIRLPLNPYKVYALRLTAHGLYSTNVTTERLAFTSLLLSLSGEFPVVERDMNCPNSPTKTGLTRQTAPVTTPTLVPNAVIDGGTDIQALFQVFDNILSAKLRSGIDDESEIYPVEHLQEDAAYSIIAVPLYGSGAIRCSDAATRGLPYIGVAPGLLPTADRRIIPVPTGFTLHHVVAVQNLNSYPCPLTRGYATFGTDASANTLWHKIGVNLLSMGDTIATQQLAYLEFTNATLGSQRIDRFMQNLQNPNYNLHHVPLVSPVGTGNNQSYYLTGNPIYMGEANSTTANRNVISAMPEIFGGGAPTLPATKGTENFVEIRWVMEDTVVGLGNPGTPSTVLVGTGGHFVYLIGKQITSRGDK